MPRAWPRPCAAAGADQHRRADRTGMRRGRRGPLPWVRPPAPPPPGGAGPPRRPPRWAGGGGGGGRRGGRDARPAAIVLDRRLPRVNGVDVCRRLRSEGNAVPIIMLTARSAVPDRISGLDAGADDYLVKPFSLGELAARLRALGRRGRSAQRLIEAGGVEVGKGAPGGRGG